MQMNQDQGCCITQSVLWPSFNSAAYLLRQRANKIPSQKIITLGGQSCLTTFI